YPSMSAVPPIASEGLSGLAQLTERRRTCRRKRCSELASPLVSSPGVSSHPGARDALRPLLLLHSERLARSSFDHLLPVQGSVKAGPRVAILSRNLAAGSAFAMLVDVWRARSSNSWWRAWDCPGNKVRSGPDGGSTRQPRRLRG